MSGNSKDLRAKSLPALNWESSQRAESLRALVEHVVARADEATEWYLNAKWSKRAGAWTFRAGAIILTAAAGILPIVQQIYTGPDGRPFIAPAWASVLVAIAVLLIAFDRFFGFSNGWMRYITAELAIKKAREAFELDWQAALASNGGQPPTDEQVRAIIAMIRAFADQINTVVTSETAKWIGEFQEALRQIDETTKTPVPVAQTGSLAITVDNGDTVDKLGWAVSLDGGALMPRKGKMAAFSGLQTGEHVVRITAKKDSKDLSAEAVVQVRAGEIATLLLSLA